MSSNSTHQEVVLRRKKVNNEIAKHNYKAEDIAKVLNLPVKQVYNDLQWIRKDSMKWLDKWALDGYTLATKNTIEQLERMERNLQDIIMDDSQHIIVKLRAYKELRETINLRWVVQGEGPTLMNLKRFGPNGKETN